MTSLVASRHFASAEEDLSRHLLASLTNATLPTGESKFILFVYGFYDICCFIKKIENENF